jgi:hypothetical protein
MMNEMSQTVKKIILFTLSACPLGRSMNTVIRECLTYMKDLSYETVHVDVDHKTTNHYRVKMNPTTLFLDANDRELYRIEGFMETQEVLNLFRQVDEGTLRSEVPREENRALNETYTLYLYRNGQVVPVEVKSVNRTSVKAPRITAIKRLLSTRPEGFENPFPADASLERVSFNVGYGVVTLYSTNEVSKQDTERMAVLLKLTLAVYGVKEVKLEWITDSANQNEGV